MERSWNSSVEISPNCPRCGSSNTKFCYYNNYSLTQPRYFCKACRRYWTKGGSLRNVPVGGGCRKNRRPNKSLRDLPNRPPHLIHRPTLLPAASHIDLALVYANFVNSDNHIPPETPLTLPLPTTDLDSGEGCFGELESVVDRKVVNGYDSFGLPPFPGEDHDECLWSPSTAHALMKSSSSTSQLLGIEAQEPNLVSWSPFDLPTFDTFSRP